MIGWQSEVSWRPQNARLFRAFQWSHPMFSLYPTPDTRPRSFYFPEFFFSTGGPSSSTLLRSTGLSGGAFNSR
jgi:hypothetical protein